MSARPPPPSRGARFLLREDARRLRAGFRHPSAAGSAGLVLPALLLGGLLASVGRVATPRVATSDDAVLLGMLVAGCVSFAAYPVLFRGADAPLLRRVGLPGAALFRERSLRLLAAALGAALLLLLPFAAAGAPLGPPLAAGAAAAVAAWGAACASLSGAARALAGHAPGRSWKLLSAGMWDREVAGAAPLVWAPLPPFLAGTAAAGWVGAAPGAVGGRALLAAAAALPLAWLGQRWYAAALPRFGPMVLEMAFEPPPPAQGGELQVGGGVAGLLPRRAAVVWARDGVVASRRYGWAQRMVWPVAAAAVVALARWGTAPSTRGWVAAAVVLVLALQGGAALGLGRLERAGRRWIDRSLGLGWPHRLLGRWAWGWGRSLWLTVPVALAWQWWSGVGAGWGWVVLGGATAGMAAAVSLLSAGWR